MDWRRNAVDAAQISGVFAVVFSLWVSIDTMQDTKEQVLTLQELVNATQIQTESLEKTLLQSQHQTIVNAYSSGGIFDLKITECGEGETQDEDGNYGMFISFKPIMINEKEAFTIVPFRIFMDLEFYGIAKGGNNYSYFESKDIGTHIYDPPNPQRLEYHLLSILTQAEKEDYVSLRIDLDYSFSPFSPVKEGSNSIAAQSEKQTKILVMLSYDEEDKKWNMLDISNKDAKIGCK